MSPSYCHLSYSVLIEPLINIEMALAKISNNVIQKYIKPQCRRAWTMHYVSVHEMAYMRIVEFSVC